MRRSCLFALLSIVMLASGGWNALAGSPPRSHSGSKQPVPTIQEKSDLVYLDVTVLDKAGKPVTMGLAKDDFLVTENKAPQTITSFETPEAHSAQAVGKGARADDAVDAKVPKTILLLDELDTSAPGSTHVLNEVREYLQKMPAVLPSPMEILTIHPNEMLLLTGYTRRRDRLQQALQGVGPDGIMPMDFGEAKIKPLEVLQQIALLNRGIPGKKNLLWLGDSGPSVHIWSILSVEQERTMDAFARKTVNMLVESRIRLSAVLPGFQDRLKDPGAQQGDLRLQTTDPFGANIYFGSFVNETGGQMYFSNDMVEGIRRAVDLESNYYTLTYQPTQVKANGEYRNIEVQVRHPGYRLITMKGYYAPETDGALTPEQETFEGISYAAFSTFEMNALPVTLSLVTRDPVSQSVQIGVYVDESKLKWERTGDGTYRAQLLLLATDYKDSGKIGGFQYLSMYLTTPLTSEAERARLRTTIPLRVRFPKYSVRIKVSVGDVGSQRIGTLTVTKKEIRTAPIMPMQDPLKPTKESAEMRRR